MAVGFISCNNHSKDVTKPIYFEFGSTMAQIEQSILPFSDSLNKKMNEPIQLPTAKNFQSQLDVFGFVYAGQKRKVELVFADDALEMIWILTKADEEGLFIEKFKKLYGEPTHIKDDITFFLNNGVAVRNKPHEVLFISKRLKNPYEQWLENSD